LQSSKQSSVLALLSSDPDYEQERLHSIQQFQQSMLKKVDELRIDIGRAAVNVL